MRTHHEEQAPWASSSSDAQPAQPCSWAPYYWPGWLSICVVCLHPIQSCHVCLMNFKDDVSILANRKAVLDSSGLGLKCADYKADSVSSAHPLPSLFFLSDCGFTSSK